MKKIKTVLLLLLTVYLSLSIAASAVYCLTDDIDLQCFIVWNRCGLLVADVSPGKIAILSPFNNACDLFLLVADWEGDCLRLYSDGFAYFGMWWD